MIAGFIKGGIRLYQYWLSSFCHGCCRFVPTCSDYAVEAVATHGIFKGSWLAVKRIMACHPWSRRASFDPVPIAMKNNGVDHG